MSEFNIGFGLFHIGVDPWIEFNKTHQSHNLYNIITLSQCYTKDSYEEKVCSEKWQGCEIKAGSTSRKKPHNYKQTNPERMKP